MTDFIDLFQDYFKPAISPSLFKTWAGIACLAGGLERRVWVETPQGKIFPNLYTLLIAPPGSGKFIVEQVRDIWRGVLDPDLKLPTFKVAPKNVTKAALVDKLVQAKQNKIIKGEIFPEYHSLLVAAEDFGTLVPSFDREYINTLNDIWNNPELHDESRRHGPAQELKITQPILNILGGAQPNYLSTLFADEQTWENGMSRRVIMLYSSGTKRVNPFASPSYDQRLKLELSERLSRYSQAHGRVAFSDEAIERIGTWYDEGQPPEPTHAKLRSYNTNRGLFLMKLSCISSMSRGSFDYRVTLEDVNRAMTWLFAAEATMPDVFRAMAGKSDVQILEELHYALTKKYGLDGKKGVDESWIWAFMKDRTTTDKIEKLLYAAEKAGLFGIDGARRYHPKEWNRDGREY